MFKKLHVVLVVALLLAMILAACERSALTSSPVGPTATGQFPNPFPSAEDPMETLRQIATQTARAAGTAQTPMSSITPQTSETPTGTEEGGTATVTATVPFGFSSATPTTTSTTPIATIATTTPGRPATYTLRPGEFPYCIARRFNVNPDELLSLNGLTDGQIYYPDLVLKIPQTGNPFPADRAWHSHPATYTVRADDTLYSVACYYGDVEPLAIAAANNLAAPYTLRTGQILSIP